LSTSKVACSAYCRPSNPKGDARQKWEFLHELTRDLTGLDGYSTVEGLFNEMAADVPALRGLTWAGLGDLGVTIPI